MTTLKNMDVFHCQQNSTTQYGQNIQTAQLEVQSQCAFGSSKKLSHHMHIGILPTDRLSYSTEMVRYGDGAGNTVEKNSSVFSPIRMR